MTQLPKIPSDASVMHAGTALFPCGANRFIAGCGFNLQIFSISCLSLLMIFPIRPNITSYSHTLTLLCTVKIDLPSSVLRALRCYQQHPPCTFHQDARIIVTASMPDDEVRSSITLPLDTECIRKSHAKRVSPGSTYISRLSTCVKCHEILWSHVIGPL